MDFSDCHIGKITKPRFPAICIGNLTLTELQQSDFIFVEILSIELFSPPNAYINFSFSDRKTPGPIL